MAAPFSLKSMFSAVHEAVVTAAQDVEEGSWWATKDRYFEEGRDGHLTPRTISIKLPHAESGKVVQQLVDVPLFSLSKHHSLVMDELNIEFDVDLRGMGDDGLVGTLSKKFLTGKSKARVKITFKGADASEGVMLLNDKIHQTFPR